MEKKSFFLGPNHPAIVSLRKAAHNLRKARRETDAAIDLIAIALEHSGGHPFEHKMFGDQEHTKWARELVQEHKKKRSSRPRSE